MDDNCDSVVDEGHPLGGAPCTVVGAFGPCAAGLTSCVAGPLTCVPSNAPSMETCDGIDNNCDGIMDNAPVPAGSPSLSTVVFGQTAVLGWNPLPDASRYDIVRGNLGTLRGSGGDFTAAVQQCLANNLPDTAVVLSGSPGPGAGFFYLVRARNCGGAGTYDSADPAQVGLRDPEIAASPLACP